MIFTEDAYFSPSEDIRPLHIWLPDDYDRTQERYPVMYMFDGHNLFADSMATYGTCWGLKEFFEHWGKPMICVGLECSHRGNERLKEYSPYHLQDPGLGELDGIGRQTLDWIVQTLKPYIDHTYRTYSFREATGIAGSSMGGLMSLYGIVCHNQIFSKAACLSSTVTPCLQDILADIGGAVMDADTRVYVSYGEQEAAYADQRYEDQPADGDGGSYTAFCHRLILKALRRKGVMTRLYLQPQGRHCEADWALQVPQFMEYLWY